MAMSTMASQSTDLDTAYRTSLSINNMAVLLLEHSCNQQAIESFRDALTLMQIASSSAPVPGESSSTAPTPETSELIKRLLQEATSRLSHPNPTVDRSLHPKMMISVIADDSDCQTAIESVSRSLQSTSHALLIRIEEYGDETVSQRDLDLDCAIILQNFGISYLCFSAYAPSQTERNRRKRKAITLLHFAQTIISNRSSECDENSSILEKVLFLALIATRSHAQVLMSVEKTEAQVRECYKHLADLKIAIRRLGYAFFTHSKKLAPAA